MTTVIERVGLYSILVSLFLLALKVTMAAFSGSLALAAATLHNGADLLASGAVGVGLKLAHRHSRAFPYGLYKVENVVAVVVAVFIFFTAYEVAKEAVVVAERQTTVHSSLLLGTAVAALVPWWFGRYEYRVGQTVNSPSLMADATEFQAHVLSSGIVFAGLAGQSVGWPLDRFAALFLVVWLARAGWATLADSLRVLLDASVEAETLRQVRQLIEQQPAVVEVRSVLGRNAGRYRFLEVEVGLRVQALDKAHQVSQAIEVAIRNHVPHVERVLVHVEPAQRTGRCVAIPLADRAGTVSAHFGAAPYFALAEVHSATGEIGKRLSVVNPYARDPRGRGLKVAHWLLAQRVDLLIRADDIREKGPGYALGDAGVSIRVSESTTLEAVLAAHCSRPSLAEHHTLPLAKEQSKEDPRPASQKGFCL